MVRSKKKAMRGGLKQNNKERSPRLPKMTDDDISALYDGLCKHGKNFTAILKDPAFSRISRYSRLVTLKDERFVNFSESLRSRLAGSNLLQTPSRSSPFRPSLPFISIHDGGSAVKPPAITKMRADHHAIKMFDIEASADESNRISRAQFNVQLDNGKRAWIPKGKLVTQDQPALRVLIRRLKVKLRAAEEEMERLGGSIYDTDSEYQEEDEGDIDILELEDEPEAPQIPKGAFHSSLTGINLFHVKKDTNDSDAKEESSDEEYQPSQSESEEEESESESELSDSEQQQEEREVEVEVTKNQTPQATPVRIGKARLYASTPPEVPSVPANQSPQKAKSPAKVAEPESIWKEYTSDLTPPPYGKAQCPVCKKQFARAQDGQIYCHRRCKRMKEKVARAERRLARSDRGSAKVKEEDEEEVDEDLYEEEEEEGESFSSDQDDDDDLPSPMKIVDQVFCTQAPYEEAADALPLTIEDHDQAALPETPTKLSPIKPKRLSSEVASDMEAKKKRIEMGITSARQGNTNCLIM